MKIRNKLFGREALLFTELPTTNEDYLAVDCASLWYGVQTALGTKMYLGIVFVQFLLL